MRLSCKMRISDIRKKSISLRCSNNIFKYNSNFAMGISVTVYICMHTHTHISSSFCRIKSSFCPSGCYVSSHFRRPTTSTYLFFFFFWHNDINLSRTAALKSPSNRVMFSSGVGGLFTNTYTYIIYIVCVWMNIQKNGYIPS